MPAVAAVLSRYSGDQLASFIEVAIGLLDVADGDVDADEGDTEDAFSFSRHAIEAMDGPGCPVSETPERAGDEADAAYVEWTSKPAKVRRKAQHEVTLGHEDDELAGDETDGHFAEDEEAARFALLSDGPGCVASDVDKGIDDDRSDPTVTEWHTRGRRKDDPGIGRNGQIAHEDDEDDDPSGQCNEDGVNTLKALTYTRGAGCPIADPGGCEHDGREPEDGV